MPQSSRMMVTLPASRSQRATSGSPFAWSSAEEEDRNRRRRTRFFRQRQCFMLFFFSVQDMAYFLLVPRQRSVRRCEQFTCVAFSGRYPPPPPPGCFCRLFFLF